MNSGDDDSRSTSSVSSTGAVTTANNRRKFLAARERAASLQRDLDARNAELQEARIQIRLLEFQLDQSKAAVTSLLHRLNGDQPADASRPCLPPHPSLHPRRLPLLPPHRPSPLRAHYRICQPSRVSRLRLPRPSPFLIGRRRRSCPTLILAA